MDEQHEHEDPRLQEAPEGAEHAAGDAAGREPAGPGAAEQVVVLSVERRPVPLASRLPSLVRRPGVVAAAGATATLGLGLAVSVARQVLAQGLARRAAPAAVEVTGRIVHHVVHHHVVHHVTVVRQVLPPG